MFEYHNTQDGLRMLICEMEDEHLMNTIKFFSRKFQEMKKYQSQTSTQSEYEKHLYNRKTMSPKDLADKTKEFANLIAPYILEAVLRGFVMHPLIQEVFGRKEKVQQVGIQHRINGTQDLSALEIMMDGDEEWED